MELWNSHAGANLSQVVLGKVAVVDEVHAADALGQQVEYGHCDQPAVEAVALVPGTQALARGRLSASFQRRVAEEVLERRGGDALGRSAVHRALVVFEELESDGNTMDQETGWRGAARAAGRYFSSEKEACSSVTWSLWAGAGGMCPRRSMAEYSAAWTATTRSNCWFLSFFFSLLGRPSSAQPGSGEAKANLLFGLGISLSSFADVVLAQDVPSPPVHALALVPGGPEGICIQAGHVSSSPQHLCLLQAYRMV